MENSTVKISDEKLLRLCEKFGKRALLWRRKFTGLLPEVNRRRLYERRGCGSIFEFAAKLAGLSEEQVRLVLRLERKFEDKPSLYEILVEGKVSLSKLARVASLANVQNEMELAEKVKLLPQKALETLVRDERILECDSRGRNGHALQCVPNGFSQPLFEVKSVRAHVFNFEVSEEVTEELNRLHEQGQDVNRLLLDLLKQRNENIRQKKRKTGRKGTAHRFQVYFRPSEGHLEGRIRPKVLHLHLQKVCKRNSSFTKVLTCTYPRPPLLGAPV
ncbi:MAG: hypothetical protein WC924_01645 [Candidatus Gracilibacteria bacterium]